MGFRRYYTAFRRYKRSKGFGIHSPFAFRFVLNVLRERSAYYAYSDIESVRKFAKSKLKHFHPHPRIISLKNAKLTFRITNYYNPENILQIGTSYGVSSYCMLRVNSASRLWLYEPNFNKYPATELILNGFLPRISIFPDIDRCVSEYSAGLKPQQLPFILVNDVCESDFPAVLEYLKAVCQADGTIIMRNVSRSRIMRRLWFECRDCAHTGMSFSNEKFAVITASAKLPHQHFLLWF